MVQVNFDKITPIEELIPEYCFGLDPDIGGIDICAYTYEICTCCILFDNE